MHALVRKAALQFDVSMAESQARMNAKIASLGAFDNRAATAAALGGRFPLGSHDDTTVEHVVEARALGATLCDLPVTLEPPAVPKNSACWYAWALRTTCAANRTVETCRHARRFAEGLVDMLCSDYHFPSLLGSAVRLIASGTAPCDVAALLALNPARHLGRDAESGSIEPGKRADLVAFQSRAGYADVTQCWIDGERRFAVSDRAGRIALAP